MTNQDVARLLENLASLLSLKGESPFRVRAYTQAAGNVAALTEAVEELRREGRLESIPGVGESIAAKIDEYLRTGRVEYYEQLKREIAPGAAELLEVPGIGPARARELYDRLGIVTLADLEVAAREHRLAGLPGIGARTEEKILREVARLRQRTRRYLLGDALPAAEEVAALLRANPAVRRLDIAGSLRRMRDTIGDFDLLAASERPEEVTAAFAALPLAREVLMVGPTRAAILTDRDFQIDLRVVHPDEYGSALQHFTGSKEHSIALRDRAIARGYRLSEYGLFETASGRRVASAAEEDVYRTLGLEWMPPELRENRGELEAAAAGRLPDLVELTDLRGDLHLHTDWSDGEASLEAMARAARDRGYEYVVVTDHSRGLGVARGLPVERLRAQRDAIAALNRDLAPFRVLQGSEVEIRADGTLDYPDEVLAELDLVGVSVHSRFGQPEGQMTERILRAIGNPLVTMLNHPTGRLLEQRGGYAVDLQRVIAVAAAAGVALEINGQPSRLDLDDVWSRRAAEAGALLAVSSDAHSAGQLGFVRWGIAVARRAWLTPAAVLNARPLAELLEVRDRRRRRARAA